MLFRSIRFVRSISVDLLLKILELYRAACCWGAERLREEIGAPLPPRERPSYDNQVTAARAAGNDDAAFESAWREGRAMTLEQAIEYALNKQEG